MWNDFDDRLMRDLVNANSDRREPMLVEEHDQTTWLDAVADAERRAFQE